MVTGMLERGKTDREIATHLAEIEEHSMRLEPRQVLVLEQVVREIRQAVGTSSELGR
jgi:hypothetical protein